MAVSAKLIVVCSVASVGALSIGQSVQLAKTEADLLAVAKTFWLPTDDALAPHLIHQKVHHDKRQRWSAQLLEKIPSISDLGSPDVTRVILAASLPFNQDSNADTVAIEGQYILMALQGIHRVLGKSKSTSKLSPKAVEGIMQLIDRAEALASEFELPDALSVRWACRGILKRIDENIGIPNLDTRVRHLPFEIHPKGVSNCGEMVEKLHRVIPFQKDTIVTRTGTSVEERRATAWLAEDGIGALAYSGKLMPPKLLSPIVRDIMRDVETKLGIGDHPYFDCALCNYYPDSEAACKFHTDPEHGSMWERLTCVIAFGDSRRFAFRPATSWDDGRNSNRPAVIDLFPGDIVRMDGQCNDDYLHAVFSGRDFDSSNDGRISLVFKRAITRSGGKRGHGLQGEGRRSKRRQQ